jgi:hypothetical protein
MAVSADEQKYAEDVQAFLLTRLFSRADMILLGISKILLRLSLVCANRRYQGCVYAHMQLSTS